VGALAGVRGACYSMSMQQGVDRVTIVKISRAAGEALAAMLAFALVACGRQTETQGQAPAESRRPQVVPRQAPGPSAAAPSAVRENHFELKMTSQGPYTVGVGKSVEIVLDALGGYKVNQEYPYKFKLQPTAGVTFPIQVVKKDRVKLDKRRATMTVPFTPTSEGAKRVAGQFAFSVCTDEKCLIEKRELSFAFDAVSPQ
jgi:hypothetical protein